MFIAERIVLKDIEPAFYWSVAVPGSRWILSYDVCPKRQNRQIFFKVFGINAVSVLEGVLIGTTSVARALLMQNFLLMRKGNTEVRWVCQSCSASELSSDCSDDEPSNNPSIKDILRTINKKFAELEAAITFNGNIMDDLQKTIKSLTEENKRLTQEQGELKNKVTYMEKEILELKSSADKEQKAERRKNLRERLLEKRKALRLAAEVCGIISNSSPVYINENFPRLTRELFKKERELKTKGYK
nr:unnamed protein product [Callosobruchus analis]